MQTASLHGNLVALVTSCTALIGSQQPMKSNRQSESRQVVWPFDLRVFAVLAGLWSLCLAISSIVPVADVELVDPIETIFAAGRFAGSAARAVLIVQCGNFPARARPSFFPPVSD